VRLAPPTSWSNITSVLAGLLPRQDSGDAPDAHRTPISYVFTPLAGLGATRNASSVSSIEPLEHQGGSIAAPFRTPDGPTLSLPFTQQSPSRRHLVTAPRCSRRRGLRAVEKIIASTAPSLERCGFTAPVLPAVPSHPPAAQRLPPLRHYVLFANAYSRAVRTPTNSPAHSSTSPRLPRPAEPPGSVAPTRRLCSIALPRWWASPHDRIEVASHTAAQPELAADARHRSDTILCMADARP